VVVAVENGRKQGKTPGQITLDLADAGYNKPNGKPYSRDDVKKLIKRMEKTLICIRDGVIICR
jgi:hypothetical protein